MAFDIIFETNALATMLKNSENQARITLTTANTKISTVYATDVTGTLYGYDGTEVHFKAPSEHKIEGKVFDAEIQIVHEMQTSFKNKNTGYAFTKAIVSIPLSLSAT